MSLQNLKNYLIFLIAVSHMLYNGYHADEKVSEETADKKTGVAASSLSAPDSTLTENPADNFRLATEAGKLEKSTAVGSTATGTLDTKSMASGQSGAFYD
jgi:hypothetical protein